MTADSRSLETLAVAGHGGAVVVHALAATWHLVQDRRLGGFALFHITLALFSAASIAVHARRLEKENL